MKTITAQPLRCEDFREYGEYTDLCDPRHPFRAEAEPQFYPDRAVLRLGDEGPAGISVSIEAKRAENVIEFAEFHQNTGEGLLCLDDDVIIYCAPASDTAEVPLDYLRAFYVPRGTFVCLKPGVWHGCQFPVHEKLAHILIVLPERTYARDCTCVYLQDGQKLLVR